MSTDTPKQPVEKVADAASQVARAERAPAPVRRFRTTLFQWALFFVALAFGILTVMVKVRPSFTIDLSVTHDIQLIRAPLFVWFMDAISWFGFSPQSFIVTALIIALIYAFGLRWEAVSALFASIFSTLVNVFVKNLVQRPRPASSLVEVFAQLKSYSFPSGHVMFYLSFFGFVWFLVFTLLKPSPVRTLLLVFFGILIAFIGISRVYLGEHWASDALGSYLLGSLTLVVIIRFYLWGKKRYFVRQPADKPPANQ
jgi:undecaprenyl-diphosphatase